MSYPIAGNVKTHSAKGYSVEHALVVSGELFHVEQICASDVFGLAAEVVNAALPALLCCSVESRQKV